MLASTPAASGGARARSVHGPVVPSTSSAHGTGTSVETIYTQKTITRGSARRAACCVKRLAKAHEKAVTRPKTTAIG